jgi:hypothetical protein
MNVRRTMAGVVLWLAGCGTSEPVDRPCPAEGEVGTGLGQVLPPLVVRGCDGEPVALRDLVCGTEDDPRPPYTLLDIGSAIFAECVQNTDAYAIDPEYDGFQARGLRIVQVFDLDQNGLPPDGTWCESYEAKHHVDFDFLIDPDGATAGLAPTHPWSILLDDTATVVREWKGGPVLDQEDVLDDLLP